MRGAFRAEPKFLGVFTNLNEGRFSAGAATPGGIFQFECDVLLGQNQNSWQYVPM